MCIVIGEKRARFYEDYDFVNEGTINKGCASSSKNTNMCIIKFAEPSVRSVNPQLGTELVANNEEKRVTCKCIPKKLVDAVKDMTSKQLSAVDDLGFGFLVHIEITDPQ